MKRNKEKLWIHPYLSLFSIRSSLLQIPRECLGQFIRFRSLPKLYYFLLNECFFLFSLHNKLLYTAVAMAEIFFIFLCINWYWMNVSEIKKIRIKMRWRRRRTGMFCPAGIIDDDTIYGDWDCEMFIKIIRHKTILYTRILQGWTYYFFLCLECSQWMSFFIQSQNEISMNTKKK